MPKTSNSSSIEAQIQFAAHLRHPDLNPSPEGIEDRRMQVYRDLFYKNVESFLAGTFPILKSITKEQRWHDIVRDFFHRHQSHTPYFSEISQEFLAYLQQEFVVQDGDPEFLLELAHYEWVELALDISEEDISSEDLVDDLNGDNISLSPLAILLSYQWPVHRVGVNFSPETRPDQLTHLVVYRKLDDSVCFMEVNELCARLLQLLSDSTVKANALLLQLSEEFPNIEKSVIEKHGMAFLEELKQKNIIIKNN